MNVFRLTAIAVLCLLMIVGCQPRRHNPNITVIGAGESAHQEVCSLSGAFILEAADLYLECGASLADPITPVEIAPSILVGTDLIQEAASATYECTSFGVGELPCLLETDEFVIEVAASLDDLSRHNDLIDNNQVELDIRLQGDGARLKFLRKVRRSHSYGTRWEEVSTTTLPLERFLGARTFAGVYSAATMSVFIDGVLVASHYSPERTSEGSCESYAEVGKGCIGRIQRVALAVGNSVDLAESSDALVLGDLFLRGDVDASGEVNDFDIKVLRDQVALGQTHLPCLEASDVNNDGALDLLDVIALVQLVNDVQGGAVLIQLRDEDGDDLTCVQFN